MFLYYICVFIKEILVEFLISFSGIFIESTVAHSYRLMVDVYS